MGVGEGGGWGARPGEDSASAGRHLVGEPEHGASLPGDRTPEPHAHGNAPALTTQRAAASSARLGPADDPAGGEGVARAGRVHDFVTTGDAGRSSPSKEQPRAPRLRIQRALSEPPTIPSSSSLPEDDVGRELLERTAECFGPEVADRAPGGEVDAEARSTGRAKLRRCAAAKRIGSRRSE